MGKKNLAWFMLSITGLVLSVVVLGLMAMPISNAVSGGVVSDKYSFYKLITFLYQPMLNITWYSIIFFMFIMLFVWEIITFVLHIMGTKKGDKYKYINCHVSRIPTLLLCFIQFIGLAILFFNSFENSALYLSGFYVLFVIMFVLIGVQVAKVSLLKWQDKKLEA